MMRWMLDSDTSTLTPETSQRRQSLDRRQAALYSTCCAGDTRVSDSYQPCHAKTSKALADTPSRAEQTGISQHLRRAAPPRTVEMPPPSLLSCAFAYRLCRTMQASHIRRIPCYLDCLFGYRQERSELPAQETSKAWFDCEGYRGSAGGEEAMGQNSPLPHLPCAGSRRSVPAVCCCCHQRPSIKLRNGRSSLLLEHDSRHLSIHPSTPPEHPS